MDDIKRRREAACIVIGIAVTAGICILAILAGSYIYLGSVPETPAATPTPTPEPTQIAAPTSAPIQASNPFHIETMKCDGARRTYTFTLTLEPGAHPAEISKIMVNATHAGKDYGTVWAPGSGMMAWNKKTYDDGALHYGDELTIIIDVAAHDIPMDEKRTQITFFYDGRAAFTQDMEPV